MSKVPYNKSALSYADQLQKLKHRGLTIENEPNALQEKSMANMIEIYTTADNQTEIKVQFDADTVWLSQLQMSELFGRDRTVITRHIGNIFKDQELDKVRYVQNLHMPQNRNSPC